MEKVICPFCEENETEIDNGDILLCDKCARYLGDRVDHADLINRSDW